MSRKAFPKMGEKIWYACADFDGSCISELTVSEIHADHFIALDTEYGMTMYFDEFATTDTQYLGYSKSDAAKWVKLHK